MHLLDPAERVEVEPAGAVDPVGDRGEVAVGAVAERPLLHRAVRVAAQHGLADQLVIRVPRLDEAQACRARPGGFPAGGVVGERQRATAVAQRDRCAGGGELPRRHGAAGRPAAEAAAERVVVRGAG
ncbi:hypothetical protein [Amycolatopsis sp. RTGN1]|uniref:hypothetical protein n=1 Tax=Amycolatopsis ponsaeliensis TaxID=2992142 RepID=UPI00254BF986|nr:hypothetical protein [Amycolatopsis sp. RTGN1]